MFRFSFITLLLLNCFHASACGLSGTINERIRDCEIAGYQKEGFKYVSRDTSGHYLILDEKTNLIWSQHLTVAQQLKYYGKVEMNTIRSICQRFRPFGLITSKAGWRLPTIKELKRTSKRGNEIGRNAVLSSSTVTLNRMVYDRNTNRYNEEFKSAPRTFDESDRSVNYESGSLEGASFRCVVELDV